MNEQEPIQAPEAPAPEASVPEASAPTGSGGTDAFDWGAWDGELSSLPEDLRGTYEPAWKRLSELYAEREQSLRNLSDLYQALLDNTDAEVPKLVQENESLKARIAELEARPDTDPDAIRKQVVEELSQSYLRWFRLDHPEYLSDEEKQKALLGLLDEGWSPEGAVRVLTMPKKYQDMARQAVKEDGMSDFAAYRLARAEMRADEAQKVQKTKRRPSTAAASSPPKASQPAARRPAEVHSLDEARQLAAKRALNR